MKMSTKSERPSRQSKVPRFGYAFAVSAVVLGAAVSISPAVAATVTYDISFSDSGGYSCCVYDNSYASGSFKITFDPTVIYTNQTLAGFVSNLTYSVTDPYLGGDITASLSPITAFSLEYGVLSLYSNFSDLSKTFTVPDLLIGINGVPTLPPPIPSVASAVWYSYVDGYNVQANGGSATIVEDFGQGNSDIATPLPAAFPLFASGLGALGLLSWRRKRKPLAA
jgi:hypothetical protein